MKTRILLLFAIVMIFGITSNVMAEPTIDGFVQTLVGGRLDDTNPTSTEMTASETRLQLRLEQYGDQAEFFGRVDFLYDGSLENEYEWELREAYMKFKLGSKIDIKVGRQILTWGTGDLIFINDLFAKDYRSFFVGRDDQYLKAPQNAFRVEHYSGLGNLDLVWTPRFEANRLPTGDRLSYYSPFANNNNGGIVGTGISDQYLFEVPLPDPKFKNGEFAARLSRGIGYFNTALYFYTGFYKNPTGMKQTNSGMVPYYPNLNVWGASARGAIGGGVLWIEGGYYMSRDDDDGLNPFIPNSSAIAMLGFERQIATNLTANLQWQADAILDYDNYKIGQASADIRDEVRHLVTSRISKLLFDENLTLSFFGFYSPTDEDAYIRLNSEYRYTDEVTLSAGANIFDGNKQGTEFGQFQKNDNIFVKMTYGF